MVSFSVVTNTEKLFNTKKNPLSNNLGCLDGIRVISMMWILLGHRYASMIFMPLTNLAQVGAVSEVFQTGKDPN